MSNLNLPIGISDYKKLCGAGYYFVDKTLFIKDVITNPSEVLLFTRPRRFGKTINLSMLYYFLTENPNDIIPELFGGTLIENEIALCKQYQNQHPVIFITFKGIKEYSYSKAETSIRGLIGRVYKDWEPRIFSALDQDEKAIFASLKNKNSDWDDLKFSLKHLCGFIKRVLGRSPYLLIDEYDTPITASYVNGYYEEMIELVRGMLGEGLKDNSLLAKGIITGITKVSQESIFSGLNNIDSYSMLREQSGEFFGFCEEEVIKLLSDDNHPEYLTEIKKWYNGYQIGENTLYNPWSILNCIKQNYKFEPYWLNTSDNALIKDLISSDRGDIKTAFVSLLQNNDTEQPIDENLVYPNLKTNDKSIWSLLHASGYLNISKTENKGFRKVATLSIPNKEVAYIYHEMIENWFTGTLAPSSYNKFVQALSSGNVEEFKTILSNYLAAAGSYFDFSKNTPEQVFHSFMLGIVIGLKDDFTIESNKEAGYGRYDLMLIPKDSNNNGIILEFKTANNEDELRAKTIEALGQIKDKKYTAVFSQHKVKSVLLLGLAFYGKQVEVSSEIINP